MNKIFRSILLTMLVAGFTKGSVAQTASFVYPIVPICSNSTLNFSNTSTGANTYMWVMSGPAIQDTSYSTNLLYSFTTCGAFNIQLTASLNGNNPNTTSQSLTVNCIPTANFQIVSQFGCVPDNVNFIDNSTQGSSAITGYQWDFNDGANSSIQNPSHTYIQAGNYSPALMIYDAAGCSDTLVATNGVIVNGGNTLQPSASPSNICLGNSSQLNVNGAAGDYVVSQIPYSPITGVGTLGPIGDDVLSGAIPIGFNFDFYGTNYNQLYISTNGFVTFSGGSGAGCCNGQLLPNSATPNNMIAGIMADLNCLSNFGTPDTISYFVSGVSPNRVFTINYDSIHYFSANGFAIFQIQLYETSNIIEVHVFENTIGGFNQTPTLGIENANGTLALSPVNHNQHAFSVYGNGPHEAWRFTPVNIVTWSPSSSLNNASITNPLATPTTTTTYTATYVDPTGCNYTGSVAVNVFTNCNLQTFLGNDTTVCAGSPVQLNSTTVFGTQPYSYSWSPATGLSNSTISNPVASVTTTTTYVLTVTDATATTATDTIIINVNPLPTVSINPVASICYNTCVGLVGSMGGGVSYFWSPLSGLSNSNTLTPTACLTTSTTYTLTASNLLGCSAMATLVVTVFPQTTLVATPSSANICKYDTATINLSGCISYSVFMGNNFSGTNPVQFYPTTNTSFGVTGVDVNGCLDTTYIQVDVDTACVWPGDANHDGLADNNDLLNIGLAYGFTGPTRSGATLTWMAQPVADWSSTFINNVNTKHADCDGNGLVDANDTTAIILNWGLTHPLRLPEPDHYKLNLPPLKIHLLEDTLHTGDTAHFVITLGDTTHPASNIYGIAFTINYDPTIVDTNSVHLTFNGNTMAPAGNSVSIEKDFWVDGKIKGAVSRTDHTGTSGVFALATGDLIVISDNIDGKLEALVDTDMFLILSDVKAVRVNGQTLQVQLQNDSALLQYVTTTEILHPSKTDISIYPNPTSDKLIVDAGKTAITSIEIVNVIGQKIISVVPSSTKTEISTASFAEGIYFVQLQTENGLVREKVVVTH